VIPVPGIEDCLLFVVGNRPGLVKWRLNMVYFPSHMGVQGLGTYHHSVAPCDRLAYGYWFYDTQSDVSVQTSLYIILPV